MTKYEKEINVTNFPTLYDTYQLLFKSTRLLAKIPFNQKEVLCLHENANEV